VPHLALQLGRRQLDRSVGCYAGPRPIGERALADAPRDEGAEREDEQRRDDLGAEPN
jgi:hypothetical protein